MVIGVGQRQHGLASQAEPGAEPREGAVDELNLAQRPPRRIWHDGLSGLGTQIVQQGPEAGTGATGRGSGQLAEGDAAGQTQPPQPPRYGL